ncbi:hypothetical protein AYI68_g6616 [Smittium mucronatum]|uniref:Uncharacterized protein n=1 Tax=Smittium mucronatum TaxID=133383 RepID=A0A1R0GNJ5_9FUNG|nr:hypothetical protein AYI68_g7494 [Smittium mucronatum]OLY79317.1 hypothetical protein AYI68_g6616 [Smittium mucronatum]
MFLDSVEKDNSWWSEAIGTSTAGEERHFVFAQNNWQRVCENVRKMDRLYDAAFESWIKNEANASLIGAHLQRIANLYPIDRIINALLYIFEGWTPENVAVVLNSITSSWASPTPFVPVPHIDAPYPPLASISLLPNHKVNTPSSSTLSLHPGHSSSPHTCSLPGRSPLPHEMDAQLKRGYLARSISSTWPMKRKARLIKALFVPYPLLHPSLVPFLAAFTLNWNFDLMSSLFSHIAYLGIRLDYSLKVLFLNYSVLNTLTPRPSKRKIDQSV